MSHFACIKSFPRWATILRTSVNGLDINVSLSVDVSLSVNVSQSVDVSMSLLVPYANVSLSITVNSSRRPEDTDTDSPGPNPHQCLWTHLQVCGSKRLCCQPDFSRCRNKGESEDHTGMKTGKKGSTLALKPRAAVTRSPKQGYQWSHEKDLCPPKI